MPYLTPDSPPEGEFFCRVLRVPATPDFLSLVDGAITELCKVYNFEQFGDLTPQETADMFLTMWLEAMDAGNVCMPPTQVDYFYHRETQGTPGGGITANTDTVLPFAENGVNQAGNVSYVGGVFVVNAGEYEVDMWHLLRADVGSLQLCWLADSMGAVVQEGLHFNPPAIVQAVLRVYYHLVLPAGGAGFRFFARSSDTRATDALGVAANVAGHDEVYGQAVWRRIGDA